MVRSPAEVFILIENVHRVFFATLFLFLGFHAFFTHTHYNIYIYIYLKYLIILKTSYSALTHNCDFSDFS